MTQEADVAVQTKRSTLNLVFPPLQNEELFLGGRVRVLSSSDEHNTVLFVCDGALLNSDKMTFFELIARGKPLTACVQMPEDARLETAI